MSEFTEMHIFFAVTTAVVVLVAAAVIVGIIRIVRILGHAERIARMAAEESALLRDDIGALRARAREEGFKFGAVAEFLRKRFESAAGMRPRQKRGKKVTNTINKHEAYGTEENESHEA